ncbi:dihydrolipoyl dehydrogenase family protein [Nocardioides sp. URHA0032]|uniref:dihydrolipoyl dehydrogenase family protein n=1 Tax=Nocardioides sp. URHA0032 TaxID=1380388 RepID=UPI00048C4EEA|nr:NAD(P)/FAD-dependent oxidoreductase [Nocardioides sp. URHA0032]
MSAHEVDLVVIGTGPGGEALANAAASAGLDVVVVEKHLVGGECPYYGCIPTKMMVRGSDAVAEVRRVPQVAGEATITPAWSVVARRISEEATAGWDDTIGVERLEKVGATVHHGVGRLAGTGRVVVETPAGETLELTARRGVLVNPGTRPAVPPVEGLADTPYWTNRDAVRLTELPGSVAIVGGGPIGCELAQVFARFGVRVTVIQHGSRLLAADEPEASALVEKVFAEEGIRVLTDVELVRAAYADGAFVLTLDTGEQLTADKVMVAAGRVPNLDDLGLETVGLDPAARTLEVDEWLRAGEKLWAIGDVTGHGAFTHVAMYQQAIALRDILGQGGAPAQYHAVPHATFTDPEVGGVGMTEQAARDAGLRVRTGSTDLAASSRGFTYGPGGHGLIKVVEDADRGVLVGATAVGPAGGEILGFLAVAVHAEVPVPTLRSMIYAYPTFHRAIEAALADLS